MGNIGSGEAVLLFYLLALVAASIPAYVVCERRGVPIPGLAFIPIVGPAIAVLRSIGSSSWLVLVSLIPIASLIFWIWLAFTVPSRHGRSIAWGIWFIVPVLNLIGFWVYAFTLPGKTAVHPSSPSSSMPAGKGHYRECPFCKEPMRRDASVCPHCRNTSEAWTFEHGVWITHDPDGRWIWLDPKTGTWSHSFEEDVPDPDISA